MSFLFSSAITKQRDRLVLCYILLSFKRPQKFHIQQTILFVLNSLLFSIKYIKNSVKKKFYVYILRLLAGKSGPFCTEFPLATFWANILKKLPFKSPAKINFNNISCTNWKVNSNLFSLRKKKEILTRLWTSILCTRWCQKVVNEKTSWQSIEIWNLSPKLCSTFFII